MTSSDGVGIARITGVLAAVAFVALSVQVEVAGSFPGDERVLVELHDAIGTSWDDAMVAIGAVTDSLVIAVVTMVACGWLARVGRRRDALLLGVTVAVALVLNPLLKELFGRPRPDVRPSPESVSSLSYPSGHASGSAALVGGLFLILPRPRPWWAFVAGALALVVVAGSRLIIGVHYPSDVIAGWLWVGALVATLAWRA